MKQASLLFILCLLFSLVATAQTTTVDKNAKRITITTKKLDENGKTVTETWIAEGDQPEKILENMAVNPEVIQKITVDNLDKKANEERLFLIRRAGDKEAIEGTLSEGRNNNGNDNLNKEENIEKIIIISNDKNQNGNKVFFRSCPASAEVWTHGFGGENRSNCAALGVYVNDEGSDGGSRISALIDQGGAKEAGLKEGDVITKINEYDIADFPSLHDALSHFQPGDIVTVRYVRDDKNQKARVELKDWAQLPGHEWRARTDCGHDPAKNDDKADNDGPPSGQSDIQTLKLQDARIFPNPTEGVFAFSFHSEPGPVVISITDVNGKVVYHENNENSAGSYNQEINLKGMPAGNYVITVNQGDKIFTQQISKQ